MKNSIHIGPKYFLNLTHKISVTLIGCGGTGSLILPRLARLDYALKMLNHPGLHVMVLDNDIVEEFNVGRQNFTPGDVGSPKALCLTEKINLAFGLQWMAEKRKVEKTIPQSNIIITAVDNVELRRNVLKATKVKTYNSSDFNRPYYWIDAGNGKDFGQVFISNIGEIKQPKSKIFKPVAKLKNIFDVYDNLHEFDNKEIQGIESCSYRESLEKQDLFINDTIANIVADMMWKLIRENQIDFNAVFVNQQTFTTKVMKL